MSGHGKAITCHQHVICIAVGAGMELTVRCKMEVAAVSSIRPDYSKQTNEVNLHAKQYELLQEDFIEHCQYQYFTGDTVSPSSQASTPVLPHTQTHTHILLASFLYHTHMHAHILHTSFLYLSHPHTQTHLGWIAPMGFQVFPYILVLLYIPNLLGTTSLLVCCIFLNLWGPFPSCVSYIPNLVGTFPFLCPGLLVQPQVTLACKD